VDAVLKRPAAADAPPPGRWAQVALQARHNFLLLAPPLLLTVVQQTVLWFFPALQDDQLLHGLFAVGLLLTMFVGIPWLLRLLLGLRPLPAGELRDRLLATARRLRFRCNDILLWDTRNSVANAMVTGPLPFLRYVVLTDRLIKEMTPDEVEAVFGHEVGHIKHHHLLFYFGFLLASMVVVAGAWFSLKELLARESVQRPFTEQLPGVAAWLHANELLALLPMLLLLAGYIFVVFGFLSRRCERQADIFGCRTVSCAVFIAALEKVAWLNGISRDRPGWLQSWQHSTIARRVAFLEQMEADPEVASRFQRRVGLVKWGLLVALTAGLLALGDKVWTILGQM
jgi:Zn-dependent protease with chaperone function